MLVHTITPPPSWGTLFTTLTSCDLPGTVKARIHLWREHFSSVHRRWAFAHKSCLWSQTTVGSRPLWGRWALTVCAEVIQLRKPTVLLAVQGAGLRPSCRWKSWMWRSWAGVVCGWVRLDVLPNSLQTTELVYGRKMNIRFIWQQLWWTFLQSAF